MYHVGWNDVLGSTYYDSGGHCVGDTCAAVVRDTDVCKAGCDAV